ncbi:MAG: uracil-DNA glycosylase family protein, partial [Pseudomonadota bacterium]
MPAWGPDSARVLIVGLAPGLHGAHRTGIPFFGDASGTLLLSALKESGFATPEYPDGEPIRITNVVKCLPPQNLPETGEVNRCQPFL